MTGIMQKHGDRGEKPFLIPAPRSSLPFIPSSSRFCRSVSGTANPFTYLDYLRVYLDRHRLAFREEGRTFWYYCPVASRLREDMTSIILLTAEDVRLVQQSLNY